jgi:glucosamine--fructose-6-phosphate aminotransferase (isomerizing)
MCAIIGSKNTSKLEVMYTANLPRGTFATGIVSLYDHNNQQTIKKQGTIDFDQIQLDESCDYYVGHVQAPTSAKRIWSYDTSHPFESLSWSVLHNGVLTNHEEIRSKHVNWDVNPVDTAVIPNLLQYFTEECTEECPGHEIIKKALNILEGTFALCIIDTDCNDIYLARQGSILHYNDNGDFSTLGGEGFKVVPEGVILMLRDYTTWEVVNHFEVKSPFLFL